MSNQKKLKHILIGATLLLIGHQTYASAQVEEFSSTSSIGDRLKKIAEEYVPPYDAHVGDVRFIVVNQVGWLSESGRSQWDRSSEEEKRTHQRRISDEFKTATVAKSNGQLVKLLAGTKVRVLNHSETVSKLQVIDGPQRGQLCSIAMGDYVLCKIDPLIITSFSPEENAQFDSYVSNLLERKMRDAGNIPERQISTTESEHGRSDLSTETSTSAQSRNAEPLNPFTIMQQRIGRMNFQELAQALYASTPGVSTDYGLLIGEYHSRLGKTPTSDLQEMVSLLIPGDAVGLYAAEELKKRGIDPMKHVPTAAITNKLGEFEGPLDYERSLTRRELMQEFSKRLPQIPTSNLQKALDTVSPTSTLGFMLINELNKRNGNR